MWYKVPREEQETIFNIDYCAKELMVYTTRKTVATKLAKKVGEPTEVYKTNGKISAVEYRVKLTDKNIRAFFSVSNIVGGFRKDTTNNTEDIEEIE